MNREVIECPECEDRSCVAAVRASTFKHNGREILVDNLECFRCQACGAEHVRPPQIKRNQTRIADAKRKADGLMTGDEIRAIRERFKLSQPDAAQVFGGGPNAFSKYERGEVVQSVSMNQLLKAARAYPRIVEFLSADAGIPCQFGAAEYVDTFTMSLNDPLYKSKPLVGKKRITSVERSSDEVVVQMRPRREPRVA